MGCAYSSKFPDASTKEIIGYIQKGLLYEFPNMITPDVKHGDIFSFLESWGKAVAERIGDSEIYTRARLASLEWTGIDSLSPTTE